MHGQLKGKFKKSEHNINFNTKCNNYILYPAALTDQENN